MDIQEQFLRYTHKHKQEPQWDREGILGRWPGYVNFTKVIFRGCNETED